MKKLTREFWKDTLIHVLEGESDCLIENPSIIFTRKFKAGEYDSLSNEEYESLMSESETLATLWKGLPKKAAGDLLLEALQVITPSIPDLLKIATILTKYSFPSGSDPDTDNPFTLDDIKHEHESSGLPDPGKPYDWSPKSIHLYLNEFVHGQEEAKKAASLAVYNHVEGRRSNTLFCGPTGCGKTEIWRCLAKEYPKIIRMVDASRLAADGWKGSIHLRDIFEDVPPADIRRYGLIVVLDEIDKVVCETIQSANGTDHSALIQNSLLKMLDGDVLEFGTEDGKKAFKVDCSRVSVVFLGAFEKLLKNKSNDASGIGFGSAIKTEYDYSNTDISADDLIEAGMRREIAGRINRIAVLRPLSEDDYESILKGPVLDELQKSGNCLISIDEASIQCLAEEAVSSGLGVRHMRSRLMNALDDLIYEDPEARVYSISIGN